MLIERFPMSSTSVPNNPRVRLKPRLEAATLADVTALNGLWNDRFRPGQVSEAIALAVKVTAGRRRPLSRAERELVDGLVQSHAEHAKPSSRRPPVRLVNVCVDTATRALIHALAVTWTGHRRDVSEVITRSIAVAAGRQPPLSPAQRQRLDTLLRGWAELDAPTTGGH
jgi:hypothetical protein